MPKSNLQESQSVGNTNDLFLQSKALRNSETKKRLRHLRAFERTYYKKTCEVTKEGHNLSAEHRLDDGNLRHNRQNLTYSLNKKKRWLLPEIIEQRICQHELPSTETSNNKHKKQSKKGDQLSTIDDNLKIVMYENENTKHRSNCLRYANSQAQPRVLYQNGRRFNSETLTKWINFDTRRQWGRRRRTRVSDEAAVNQPNFGIDQRPGFFPSEVTYHFLYPKRFESDQNNQMRGRTQLTYQSNPHEHDWPQRKRGDTNKARRALRKIDTDLLGDEEIDDDYCEESEDENIIETMMFMMDENEKWSIVFEESEECDSTDPSINDSFPIDFFFPIETSISSPTIDIPIDYKAQKYYEDPPPSSDDDDKQIPEIDEQSLGSIACKNEDDFLALMQGFESDFIQANISPPIFIQQSACKSFSIVYTYCRTSACVDLTLKFNGSPPKISIDCDHMNLNEVIEIISQYVKTKMETMPKPITNPKVDVDALRGSLPLPAKVAEQMIVVRPHSTDKQTALQLETENGNQKEHNGKEWFDTMVMTTVEYEMLECSVCCETLTINDAYQLLPCRHTLCHSCLTSFVRTSVSSAIYSASGIPQLTCFQTGCTTQLNFALIQTFVSHRIFQTYCESLNDRRLFASGHYRQCPSRSCSNLLVVNNDEFSLMCTCGQRVCAKCLDELHFPATCAQYKAYVIRLRQSGDHLLSVSKSGDNNSTYIAEGKNCPNCGEFVEKNGGCPHMTCRCGNEYCWMCLRKWSSHNYANCFNVPESTHELRASTRSRLHNMAVHHRRERNQYSIDTLATAVQRDRKLWHYHALVLSTYIDLNTVAEFVYVLLQRRRTPVEFRAVLGQTARRLESDAFRLKLQVELNQINTDHIEQMRTRLAKTVANLTYMKRNKVLV